MVWIVHVALMDVTCVKIRFDVIRPIDLIEIVEAMAVDRALCMYMHAFV